MSRRRSSSLFSSSGSAFGAGGGASGGNGEGVEIATEMAPGEPLRLSSELITEHIIMSEYALICRDPIDGLYAVPSARNRFEWYGLIFIRRGVYAGAVLRFTMRLPADFPSKELPTVTFDLDIFHPHVNPASRELDLKRYFVDGWKPDRHHLYHVLLIVQRTFFTFDSDPASCVNAEAATLLRDDREAYRVRASEVIRKSRSVIYDPITTDDANAIRLTPWDASIHEPLRQRLIGGLTDSQISTMSMLGSLGCGLSSSSVFESRGKRGFSWISPSDMCYMVEPVRPAELDMKTMLEVEECSMTAASLSGSCQGGDLSDLAANGNPLPEISKLDLSGVDDDDLEQETKEDSGEGSGRNDSDRIKDEGNDPEDIVVLVNDDSPVDEIDEHGRSEKERVVDSSWMTVPELNNSGCSESECLEARQGNDSCQESDSVRARSNTNTEEVGENI